MREQAPRHTENRDFPDCGRARRRHGAGYNPRVVDSGRRSELPAHLRAFLYSCIDSIEQLEVLSLLQGSEELWSAGAVARELGITDARARAYLDALAARGLAHVTVRGDMRYGFRPASAALARYCEELAIQLERSRSDVLRFVAALPPPAVRSFAHAFKLRDTE